MITRLFEKCEEQVELWRYTQVSSCNVFNSLNNIYGRWEVLSNGNLGVLEEFEGAVELLQTKHVRSTEDVMRTLRLNMVTFTNTCALLDQYAREGKESLEASQLDSRQMVARTATQASPAERVEWLAEISDMYRSELLAKQLIVHQISYGIPTSRLTALEAEWAREHNVDRKSVEAYIKMACGADR